MIRTGILKVNFIDSISNVHQVVKDGLLKQRLSFPFISVSNQLKALSTLVIFIYFR
jgi:hypothetical protein